MAPPSTNTPGTHDGSNLKQDKIEDIVSAEEEEGNTYSDPLRKKLNYDIADYLCQAQLESHADILDTILHCLNQEDSTIYDAPTRLQNRFRAAVLWHSFLTQAQPPGAGASGLRCLEREFIKPQADNWRCDSCEGDDGRSQPENGDRLQHSSRLLKDVTLLMEEHERVKELLLFLETPGSSPQFPKGAMEKDKELLERMGIGLPIESRSADSKVLAIRALRTEIEKVTGATIGLHSYKGFLKKLQKLLCSWTESVLTMPDLQARGCCGDRQRDHRRSGNEARDSTGNDSAMPGHKTREINALCHRADSSKERSELAGGNQESDDACESRSEKRVKADFSSTTSQDCSGDTWPTRGGGLIGTMVTVSDSCDDGRAGTLGMSGHHTPDRKACGNANLGKACSAEGQRDAVGSAQDCAISLLSANPMKGCSSIMTKSKRNSTQRPEKKKKRASFRHKLKC
jgi:hypothetical protein